jgi:hypothetical protein
VNSTRQSLHPNWLTSRGGKRDITDNGRGR